MSRTSSLAQLSHSSLAKNADRYRTNGTVATSVGGSRLRSHDKSGSGTSEAGGDLSVKVLSSVAALL